MKYNNFNENFQEEAFNIYVSMILSAFWQQEIYHLITETQFYLEDISKSGEKIIMKARDTVFPNFENNCGHERKAISLLVKGVADEKEQDKFIGMIAEAGFPAEMLSFLKDFSNLKKGNRLYKVEKSVDVCSRMVRPQLVAAIQDAHRIVEECGMLERVSEELMDRLIAQNYSSEKAKIICEYCLKLRDRYLQGKY